MESKAGTGMARPYHTCSSPADERTRIGGFAQHRPSVMRLRKARAGQRQPLARAPVMTPLR